MFKKVLYPTDFSDVSMKALDYIRQLREGGLKEVVVLHVIDTRGSESLPRFLSDEKMEDLMLARKEHARQRLADVEKALKEMDLKVKTRLEKGMPVREILKVEKDEDVSMVVIGSHGKSNLEEIFLGSVSEKVIRKCKNPVLVVKR